MLRSCYLFDEQGNDLPLVDGTAPAALRHALGVVLVVPRSQCLYLRLDARGIPLLRLRSYARLQLLARSPVVQPDVFVARQGDTLHLWLWDREFVQSFARRQGLPASRIEVLPSSVLTKPASPDGAVLLRTPGSAGVHAQLWQGGRLLHDGWFEEAPDALEWRTWRDDIERQEGLQWPESPPLAQSSHVLGRRWTRNLLRERALGATLPAAPVARMALGGATLATLGYGVALQAQLYLYKAQIEEVQRAQTEVSARLRPIEEARRGALEAQQWVTQADRLVQRPSATALLERIGSTVTGQGAVVRDLDIQGDIMRATLAPAAGELSLPDLTAALTQVGEFDDVRFIDAAPGKGFRFAWRLRDRDGSARIAPRAGSDRS
jgi:hypothetical protein